MRQIMPSSPKVALNHLKEDFEQFLQAFLLEKREGGDQGLWEVIVYSLQSGGKRVRPILCALTCKNLPGSTLYAQLALEFFHTASLIADDMPCMDNDDERRGRAASHKKFGEAKALLASYALISWGYEAINSAAEHMDKEGLENPYRALKIALKRVSFLAGLGGAVSGQALDLFSQPKDLKAFRDIIYKKTVTLFSLSFELGWIFGGGDLERLDEVQEMAYHFGTFFQIVDDFQDKGRVDEKSNIVRFLGEKKAQEEMLYHKNAFSQVIKKLETSSSELLFLMDYIERKRTN